MQREGVASFLPLLGGGAPVCSFHPKDQYLFASGGEKGLVQICSALSRRPVQEITLPCSSAQRRINGLQFMPDGKNIIVSCESRHFSVVDLERGEVVISYSNCVYPAAGRQPVISHPDVPCIAACLSVNGKGITLFDIRRPLPMNVIHDLDDSLIKDLHFVDGSWPWGSSEVTILSGGIGPHLKALNLTGRTVGIIPTNIEVNTLALSPGTFRSYQQVNFPSVILTGGDTLCSTVLKKTTKESTRTREVFKSVGGKVLRAKYSCSGGLLYTATKDGRVVRYRRYPDRHEVVGTLFSHNGPVLDLDISAYGDYLISASQDGDIGLLTLGAPSHGWTRCFELT